jgi:hypothetical protein
MRAELTPKHLFELVLAATDDYEQALNAEAQLNLQILGQTK